jgi:hypothetical protein
MTAKRKRHPAAFKAKVALEAAVHMPPGRRLGGVHAGADATTAENLLWPHARQMTH